MFEIIVDVREHALIEKLRGLASESKSTVTIVVETLLIGDVMFRRNATDSPLILRSGIDQILLYERKSFADLLASIKDGRYEEQSHRLIHSSNMNPHNIIYVLEGIWSSLRNPADKRVILSAMTSLSYFKGFSVFRTATTLETAELIWAMANKLHKEFENGRDAPKSHSLENHPPPTLILRSDPDHSSLLNCPKQAKSDDRIEQSSDQVAAYSNFVKKVKRENITEENIGEIMLSQIPGISGNIAAEILKHFGGSFSQFIAEIKTNPEKLDAIYLESTGGKRRKLSSAVIKSILRFLGEDRTKAVPDIKDKAVPDIKDKAVPDIKDKAVPDIKDKAVPDHKSEDSVPL